MEAHEPISHRRQCPPCSPCAGLIRTARRPPRRKSSGGSGRRYARGTRASARSHEGGPWLFAVCLSPGWFCARRDLRMNSVMARAVGMGRAPLLSIITLRQRCRRSRRMRSGSKGGGKGGRKAGGLIFTLNSCRWHPARGTFLQINPTRAVRTKEPADHHKARDVTSSIRRICPWRL
jgi:hypothetical protein